MAHLRTGPGGEHKGQRVLNRRYTKLLNRQQDRQSDEQGARLLSTYNAPRRERTKNEGEVLAFQTAYAERLLRETHGNVRRAAQLALAVAIIESENTLKTEGNTNE